MTETSTSFTYYNFTTSTWTPTEYRGYHLSPVADQVLGILLPIFSTPGIFMNMMVLWNLFVRKSKLNKPTRQLHGHLVISNLILLVVCVPPISLILYNGRVDYKNERGAGSRVAKYELNKVFCNISGFIFNVMMRMTIHISTVLALDRVLAVQFPIFHKFRIQKWGYKWLLLIIWLFNLGTMATPFMADKLYVQHAYECVCNWNLQYTVLSKFRQDQRFMRSLVILVYFFIPFTLTNLLTIICCIWVIVLLLMKNLVIKKRAEQREGANNNGKGYESLENGKHDGDLDDNSYCHDPELLDPKCKTSKILKVTRTLQSPVAMLKKKKVKLSNDVKVKRACYTMLIVMALQLFCYSVVQLMVVDQLLFHVLKENYFSKHTQHNAAVAQIFINYPLYLLVFSIAIPAVIHFRMTRNSTVNKGPNSRRGFTTCNTSSSLGEGVSLSCSRKKSRDKDDMQLAKPGETVIT
ncbi:hypothetical protein ACHWQZ_G013428 [Mnemiopsis leidyi]